MDLEAAAITAVIIVVVFGALSWLKPDPPRGCVKVADAMAVEGNCK